MRYISLSDFAARNNVSIATAKKRIRPYAKIEKIDGEESVLEGTRYPFSLRGQKYESMPEKQYLLLKAISHYKHIEASMLKLPAEQSFQLLLDSLREHRLIQENGVPGMTGADAYDCTEAGGQLLQKKKPKIVQEISRVTGTVAGAALKKILS